MVAICDAAGVTLLLNDNSSLIHDKTKTRICRFTDLQPTFNIQTHKIPSSKHTKCKRHSFILTEHPWIYMSLFEQRVWHIKALLAILQTGLVTSSISNFDTEQNANLMLSVAQSVAFGAIEPYRKGKCVLCVRAGLSCKSRDGFVAGSAKWGLEQACCKVQALSGGYGSGTLTLIPSMISLLIVGFSWK